MHVEGVHTIAGILKQRVCERPAANQVSRSRRATNDVVAGRDTGPAAGVNFRSK